jgi:ABC-2 type transport system ATP-binding protein
MKPIIELKNVSKEYRTLNLLPWKKSTRTKALRDVSFSCPEGKITTLLGPNGAGKTTILKILAGLILHDSGSIIVNTDSKATIGVATPNDRSFYWRLTGRQNLDFFASLYNFSGKEKKKHIEQVISDTKLEDDIDKPFRLFSSGMKQKLILARALIGDPSILLLDEPTAHIDPLMRVSIHDMIMNTIIKKKRTTIILCTHNLQEAEQLSDQIILLHEGRILEKGSLETIRRKVNPYKKIIINLSRQPEEQWKKHFSFLSFEQHNLELVMRVKNTIEIPHILEAIIKNKGKIISCNIMEDTILEIFTNLTKNVNNKE